MPPGGGPARTSTAGRKRASTSSRRIMFTVNGERVVAKAGTFANMPVSTPHSFRNEVTSPRRC